LPKKDLCKIQEIQEMPEIAKNCQKLPKKRLVQNSGNARNCQKYKKLSFQKNGPIKKN